MTQLIITDDQYPLVLHVLTTRGGRLEYSNGVADYWAVPIPATWAAPAVTLLRIEKITNGNGGYWIQGGTRIITPLRESIEAIGGVYSNE